MMFLVVYQATLLDAFLISSRTTADRERFLSSASFVSCSSCVGDNRTPKKNVPGVLLVVSMVLFAGISPPLALMR